MFPPHGTFPRHPLDTQSVRAGRWANRQLRKAHCCAAFHVCARRTPLLRAPRGAGGRTIMSKRTPHHELTLLNASTACHHGESHPLLNASTACHHGESHPLLNASTACHHGERVHPGLVSRGTTTLAPAAAIARNYCWVFPIVHAECRQGGGAGVGAGRATGPGLRSLWPAFAQMVQKSWWPPEP